MVDSTLKLNGQRAPLGLVIESQSLFFFHLALDAQPARLDSVTGWLNSSICVYAGTRASVLVAQRRANSSWNLPGAADKPYKAMSVAHRCSSAAVVCPRQLRASTRLQAQACPFGGGLSRWVSIHGAMLSGSEVLSVCLDDGAPGSVQKQQARWHVFEALEHKIVAAQVR